MHKHLTKNLSTLLTTLLVINLILLGVSFTPSVAGIVSQSAKGPIISDPKLTAQIVFKGLKFPSSMAFLSSNDILVLEKNDGTVRRITNGTMQRQPVLQVNVSNRAERGLLGIAISPKHDNTPTYVFLYFTESKTKDGEDTLASTGTKPLGNRLYRYELTDNNSKLVNPKLLLDLPATPGSVHNGGRIMIGPDNNLYVTIGDVSDQSNKAINVKNGTKPDGRAGILRITQDGKPVPNNPIGKKYPLSLYYAYGIRNSFGIDFDPITETLWDTENGPTFGDEINRVKPGFNSGWHIVQGMWKANGEFGKPVNKMIHPHGLVDFGGRGKYSPPEFVWKQTVAPTALKFFHSDKLGKKYQDSLIVGDFKTGSLYHFDLNKDRTELSLKAPLHHNVYNNGTTLPGAIFAHGFGGITDLQVGPDGYLYVLSLYEGGGGCTVKNQDTHSRRCLPYNSMLDGSIFRIIPADLPN